MRYNVFRAWISPSPPSRMPRQTCCGCRYSLAAGKIQGHFKSMLAAAGRAGCMAPTNAPFTNWHTSKILFHSSFLRRISNMTFESLMDSACLQTEQSFISTAISSGVESKAAVGK